MADQIANLDPMTRPGLIATGVTSGEIRNVICDEDGALIVNDSSVASVPSRALLDFTGRTDANPLYIGNNAQSALVADPTWVVKKMFYDASGRLIDEQVISGIAWTARASASWKNAVGD